MSRTILHRQPGGTAFKRPWIISNFPRHDRYVEGFAGAASVLIDKPRSSEEYLIERDPWQATLLRVVRDDVDALVEALHLYDYSRESFEAALRKLNQNDWKDCVELAALTWVLSGPAEAVN